jgi:translocation and assembly module TamB
MTTPPPSPESAAAQPPLPPATPGRRGRRSRRPRRRLLLLILLAGGAGGSWWLWRFIHTQLAPLISDALTQELSRPVRMGPLERISLSSVRFGPTTLPATPTDPDRVAVSAVEVQFNPWPLLTQRRLPLNVTLIDANGYLEQDEAGLWVGTKLKRAKEKGPIEIQLNQVRLQNATIEFSPKPKPKRPRQSVRLKNLAGFINLLDRNRRFSYYVRADSLQQGTFRVRGETKKLTQTDGKTDLLSKINIEGDNFLLSEVDRLIRLPVDIQAGRSDGKVDVTLNPDLTFGVQGRLKLKQARLVAPGTPKPIQAINGDIELADQTVKLKGVKGQFGLIPVVATGTIDPVAGFDLDVQIARLGLPTFFKTFAIKSPVPIIGTVAAQIKLTGPATAPILSGAVRNIQPVIVDKLAIAQASGNFRLNTKTGVMQLANLVAMPQVGGRVTGQGQMRVAVPQTVNLDLTAVGVPGDAIAQIYASQKPPFKIGNVSATANIRGNVNNLVTRVNWRAPESDYAATGDLTIAQNGRNLDLTRFAAQAYGGSVTATGQLRDQQWSLQAKLANANLAKINPTLTGLISGDAMLRGRLDQPNIAQTTGTINLTTQTYGGQINAIAQLADRRWQATVNLAGVQLAQANPDLRGAADGTLRLRGNLAELDRARTTVDGQVRLSQGIALVKQPIDAKFNWDGRQINLISAIAPDLFASGKILVDLKTTPTIAGLDLRVKTQNLALSTLPLTLPEQVKLRGMTDFDGRITGLPTQPQLRGQVALRDFAVNQLGFAPLKGAIDLTPGRGIQLDLAGGGDRFAFNLNGQNQPIALNVQRGAFKLVGQAQGELFNVAVAALPLDELATLGLPLPEIGGTLSGNLAVNIAQRSLPNAIVTIDQAAIGQFPSAFRSEQIQAQVSYVNGAARGSIALRQPRFGTISSNDVTTNFAYANQVLRVADLVVQKGDSRFTIAGSVDLSRPTPQVAGTLNVAQGQIADVLGALQIFRLTDFLRGPTLPTYANAQAIGVPTVGASRQSDVSLKTQLERLAELNMQIKQLALSRASLTQTSADGQSVEPILPELADIRGRFNANTRFRFGAQGLEVDALNLVANNVEWRPYPGYVSLQRVGDRTAVVKDDNRILKLQAITVAASYTAGQLNLTRAEAQMGDALAKLQLNYGGQETFAQFNLTKLPIVEIQRFYPLFSANIGGEIGFQATLNGKRATPTTPATLSGQGNIEVTEGSINGVPIATARGIFNYLQGRLDGAAALRLTDQSEPLKVRADVPLGLAMLGVEPKDQRVEGKIEVKNEGLALLNLVGAPIKWLGGAGEVNLDLGGTSQNVTASGIVALNDASFELQGLPQPLTNVNGRIQFNRDVARVEQLEAVFSQGKVAARGTLPLFNLTPNLPIPNNLAVADCLSADPNQPLNIALDRISLSYKGLYQGGVRGCVNVAGNLLQPQVTGEIALFNGQVLLADEMPDVAAAGGTADADAGAGLSFQDLRLKLDQNIQIVKAPIVNFVAGGTLTVNGNLNALKPKGEIVLKSGQVNLFTTQFVLARGYKHKAEFTPERGLDPTLDIRLISSVPEVTRSPIQTTTQTFSSEVNDAPLLATNFGSLQTVRIEAKVAGPASQLFDNLELSSSPNRSRNEIIGLIGGGFVDTLGRGDSTLGIANLAGSALLTNIQGFIGNALGLSEFRLFPTISTDEDRRSSTLGLAAETGVDITPALSASVLKILTSPKPAQFGLRYRINDNILFRGSTDFFGDNRAVFEYNVRF